jgi:hypothetical protein
MFIQRNIQYLVWESWPCCRIAGTGSKVAKQPEPKQTIDLVSRNMAEYKALVYSTKHST